MKKPKAWRDFHWQDGLGHFDIRKFPTMNKLRRQNGGGSGDYIHGVPVELCMWKGKPIDDCPNVRRTEIELFPELKP